MRAGRRAPNDSGRTPNRNKSADARTGSNERNLYATFNVDKDEIVTKPVFRGAWKTGRRCLAFQADVRSTEQIMPLFVVGVMAQLVLCGGMVPVTGRLGLDQLSWLMPARWGYAAASSTVDVWHLVPGSLLPQDRFWQHTRKVWLFDVGMLAALALSYAGFVRWKIRLRRR